MPEKTAGALKRSVLVAVRRVREETPHFCVRALLQSLFDRIGQPMPPLMKAAGGRPFFSVTKRPFLMPETAPGDLPEEDPRLALSLSHTERLCACALLLASAPLRAFADPIAPEHDLPFPDTADTVFSVPLPADDFSPLPSDFPDKRMPSAALFEPDTASLSSPSAHPDAPDLPPLPIGVDIEATDRFAPEHLLRLAARYFTPGERAAQRHAADPVQAFWGIFTAKEAYAKYTGLGLAATLRFDTSDPAACRAAGVTFARYRLCDHVLTLCLPTRNEKAP